MSGQLLSTLEVENSVSTFIAMRKRNDLVLFIVLFFTLLGLTPLIVLAGVTFGISLLLGVLGATILAAAIVRWPTLGLYIVAGCAFLVEQEPLATPVLTDHVYIFYWPSQLEGFIERPIGLIALFALSVWLTRRFVLRQPLLRGGKLLFPFLLYMLCVVGGALYGLASGGTLKVIVVEVRPFWYMFVAYLLAYNFVTQKKDIRSFFWLVIVSAGFKALQGLYIYLVAFHGDLQGHDTIMSHEESFFFAALLLLVVIFCLHHRYRPQLIAALCIAPAVIISMIANHRRTDYIALLVGIGVAWVLIFRVKPKVRIPLLVGMITCVVLATGYIIAFQHGTGTISEPARAIMSIFQPSVSDTRDSTSNQYRLMEDNDLKYTATQYPFGLGLGKAFLQPEPLTSIFPGIASVDPYYNYVPHNTIYWIWVDLGVIGYFALWFLIGTIIIWGSITTRRLHDPYLQVVAIYIVAVTMMEVVVAFADYQLFFYRNVIYLGLLCGILAKLPMLDQQEQKKVPDNELAHGISAPSRSLVGGRHT
jgi:hypothetical protein